MGNLLDKVKNYISSYYIPPIPQLHRSVNGLYESQCITINCNNNFPDNRGCMLCDKCTILFGCICGNRPKS